MIISDLSQLVRLGLTGILYQTGIALHIREIIDQKKLKALLQKENNIVLITSKTFLNSCEPDILKIVNVKGGHFLLVLVNDSPDNLRDLPYDEVVELHDTERIIYQKLEKCMQKLSQPLVYKGSNDEISQREKEVLKLVALGMTNKEIAEKLFISTHTVITHRKNITAKLGIKTIAGLTVFAVINKLISAEEIK